MKPKSRFIRSIVAAAQTNDVQLPWTRGATRQDMIARRTGAAEETPKAKSA
ncbi:hypothetical protein [Phaeobacter sp.]|uniref:hypothetical protein n=1 Tax=Phaeobacter sp. TaxID=1902409 RepID=UPI0025CE1C7E|nr:hypothetical protein [Phaeobacter sp.]